MFSFLHLEYLLFFRVSLNLQRPSVTSRSYTAFLVQIAPTTHSNETNLENLKTLKKMYESDYRVVTPVTCVVHQIMPRLVGPLKIV